MVSNLQVVWCDGISLADEQPILSGHTVVTIMGRSEREKEQCQKKSTKTVDLLDELIDRAQKKDRFQTTGL